MAARAHRQRSRERSYQLGSAQNHECCSPRKQDQHHDVETARSLAVSMAWRQRRPGNTMTTANQPISSMQTEPYAHGKHNDHQDNGKGNFSAEKGSTCGSPNQKRCAKGKQHRDGSWRCRPHRIWAGPGSQLLVASMTVLNVPATISVNAAITMMQNSQLNSKNKRRPVRPMYLFDQLGKTCCCSSSMRTARQ